MSPNTLKLRTDPLIPSLKTRVHLTILASLVLLNLPIYLIHQALPTYLQLRHFHPDQNMSLLMD
jgi:hypothetical protein